SQRNIAHRCANHTGCTSLFHASSRVSASFFFNDTPTTEIYTLPLHAALPISAAHARACRRAGRARPEPRTRDAPPAGRSEEHTSELQSHLNLVCRPLLEKKDRGARRPEQPPGGDQCLQETRGPLARWRRCLAWLGFCFLVGAQRGALCPFPRLVVRSA